MSAHNDAVAALTNADMHAQSALKIADATLAAVRALLVEPDSPTMRMGVLKLVEVLSDEMFRASNNINSLAENFGAHYTDDQWHATLGKVASAVSKNGGAA